MPKPKSRKELPGPAAQTPTQTDLANRLGITPRQIRNLVRQGMPKTWPAASSWYLKHKVGAEVKRRTPSQRSVGKDREQELKNRLLELQIADQEGRSVPTTLYRSRLRDQAVRDAGIMRSLSSYAADCVGLVTVNDAQVVLDRIMNRMLAAARGDDPDADAADAAVSAA